MRKSWTEPMIEALRELWIEGKSASQCASMLTEFGVCLTRNAIIGKLGRIGLLGKRRNSLPPRTRRRSRRKRAEELKRRIRVNSGSERFFKGDVCLVKDLPLPKSRACSDIPAVQRKTFIELEAHHCRFPYGDPREGQFFFCGAVKEFGRSYCSYHRGIAYRVAKATVAECCVS